MNDSGEKGRCLKCNKLKMGIDGVDAWCIYKNMRLICSINTPTKKLITTSKSEIIEKRREQLFTKLKGKVNPYWCPFRDKRA